MKVNPKSPCGSCCSCCCCIYITGLHCSCDSRLYNDHLHQLHRQSNLQQPKLFLLRRLFSRLNPIETSINQILTSLNDTSPIIDINAITSERGGGGGRSGWSICCCVCRRLRNSHMSIEHVLSRSSGCFCIRYIERTLVQGRFYSFKILSLFRD